MSEPSRLRRTIAPRSFEQLFDSRKARESYSGSRAGIYQNIFNPATRVQVFQGFGKMGEESIFRPMPPLDPQHPAERLFPGRYSCEPGHFSHWQQPYLIAKWVGLPSADGSSSRITLVLGRPGDGRWMERPYALLHRRLMMAKNGRVADTRGFDVAWLRLLSGDSRSGPCLPAVTEHFFIQCFVYAGGVYDSSLGQTVLVNFLHDRGQPLGALEGDPLPIFVLTRSTGQKLISGRESTDRRDGVESLLDRRRPEATDDDVVRRRYDRVFHYGDPVGTFDPATRTVRGGVFVHVFFPSRTTRPSPDSTWNGQQEEFQGYECRLSNRLPAGKGGGTIGPDLDPALVDRVFDLADFWDESSPGARDGLIVIPDVAEEAVRVVAAFPGMERLFRYAWYDHPEWFSSADARTVLRGATSFVQPAADQTHSSPSSASASASTPAHRRDVVTPPSFFDDLDDDLDADARETSPVVAADPVIGDGRPADEFLNESNRLAEAYQKQLRQHTTPSETSTPSSGRPTPRRRPSPPPP